MKEETKIYSKVVYSEIDYKVNSIIKIGNMTIYNPAKFNKLQKWLWKKLLNIEISEVEK